MGSRFQRERETRRVGVVLETCGWKVFRRDKEEEDKQCMGPTGHVSLTP